MRSLRSSGAPRRGPSAHVRAYFIVFVLLLLTTLACAPSGEAQEQPPSALLQHMLSSVNDARSTPRLCGDEAYGAAGPLRLEGRLSAAAQLHSQDMRANSTLSHTGSDGSTLVQRVERQGYPWSRLAENVAWGYDEVDEVVAGWLSSPGHCQNMMNPDYRELGVGVAGTFWTQVFGTQR